MKSLAVCYSEHAIKVSDSYCSGPSNKPYTEARPSPSTIQNAVTCIYKVRLLNLKRILIRLTWCSKLHNQGFLIGFSGQQTLHCSSPKFKENSFLLKKLKGIKTLDSCGLKIKVLWDLTRARYDSGPEPMNGFYIVVLVDSELTLFLGDDVEQELETLMKRASNYTRAPGFSLISRCESYSGNGLYTTMAKFSDTGPCHDITIKCVKGDDDQTSKMDLSVSIDKKIVTEVKRLNWNFRGNQTIFLDGLLIDLMWDVHDWLFSSGYGVFMFKTRHGFDSRLWYVEEKKKKKIGHGDDDDDDDEKVGFSLLICACQNPD